MSLSISLLLAALAMRESGQNPAKMGPCHELSQWQITRQVWSDRMGKTPFYLCMDSPKLAEECARKHIAWIRAKLAKCAKYNQIDPAFPAADSPLLIAHVWHRGWTAFMQGKPTEKDCQFAEEVSTLYFTLKAKESR